MKIVIKNMVCDRCVLVIKNIMMELQLPVRSVVMGEVDFVDDTLNAEVVDKIKKLIEPLGFELVDNKKQVLIEQVKTLLIKLVQGNLEQQPIKLSEYVADNLNQDYHSLSQLFSSIEGMTIEKYFIHLKVEKIKELLMYEELNLTEISYRLGYSSLAHLSAQFKQITGMTPTGFKKIKHSSQRLALDKI